MNSADKKLFYLPPEVKIINLNAVSPFLDLSQDASNYQNEQLDSDPSGFGDSFWD